MIGPQTFSLEAFTPEEFAAARIRIEKKGARTSYTDSFSQIPRSKIATMGPVPYTSGHEILKASTGGSLGSSSTLSRAATFSTLGREPSVSELLAGPLVAVRAGPHWPPPGPERPNPLQTREALFQGPHRTIVDLHAKDRKAPGPVAYTLARV